MIALERIVQLKCRNKDLHGAPAWESGSGYACDNGMVLTAAHVVTQADP
jgi:hypothetical protein